MFVAELTNPLDICEATLFDGDNQSDGMVDNSVVLKTANFKSNDKKIQVRF